MELLSNKIFKYKFFELKEDFQLPFLSPYGYPVILNKGAILKLAGVALSTMTASSPFHYNNDIIRIPNDIVMECKSEYINDNDFKGVVIYPTVDHEDMVQKFKDKYDDNTTLRTEILLWMFTIGVWALFFLWLWTINH